MSRETSDWNMIEGDLKADGLRFAIVAARFNSFITDRLLAGAIDAVHRSGGDASAVDVVRVPGSLEVPLAARTLAQSGKYDAVICLGAVIRGETTHFEYVAQGAARGIADISRDTGMPVIFGVLTCDTLEQAVDRAGAKGGNAGFNAAMNAIEMANLMKQLRKPR